MRPPYYKDYVENQRGGVRVAIGPKAWKFAKKQRRPTMVLPDDANPENFSWPSDGKTALIHERGTYDDNRLRSMAAALLRAGASSVVTIREALLGDYDARKFFDAGVTRVAA